MPGPIVEAINLPFEESIAFFRQKARVPTAHWDDVWRTAHSHSFMVAGAASDALLSDFQHELTKAMKAFSFRAFSWENREDSRLKIAPSVTIFGS